MRGGRGIFSVQCAHKSSSRTIGFNTIWELTRSKNLGSVQFALNECKLKDSLRQHCETVHGEFSKSRKQDLHECKICSFRTTFGKRFRRHLASHSDPRPCACQFPRCDYRAKRIDTRKTLGALHVLEYHPCPESGCTYVAKQKSLLINHRKNHNKPFPCVYPDCKKHFSSEAALLNHQRLHDPDRPFQCNSCPQGFTRKHGLATHVQLVHTEAQLFKCPHCNQSRSLHSNLQDHIRRVHKVQDTDCREAGCDFKSCSPYAMAKHKVRHEQTRPFKCEHCACRFNFIQSMKQHIWRKYMVMCSKIRHCFPLPCRILLTQITIAIQTFCQQ